MRHALLTVAAIITAAVLTGCAHQPAYTEAPGQGTGSIAEQQQTTAGIIPGYTVRIPKLGESSNLVGLGLNPPDPAGKRTIQVPPLDNPMQAGVYTQGPMPGQKGPAVVLAHINGHGQPGFGAGFHTLTAGDQINVDTPQGPKTFRVTRVGTVPKADFPTKDVYSDTPDPELVLITCGGALDPTAHNYQGQTIVHARQT